MSFTSLNDAMDDSVKKKGSLKKQIEATKIVELAEAVFSDIFGKELGGHAKPLFLKNRTLTVTCTSSALAQEIRLRQQEIVQKLNEGMGASEVDRIRYLA